ncbi:hypothetical protein [Actinoplanes subtropicus]|uniref:hypothetical protein n=1 Tax=Actinoplanes subtropicus TaxID=543632 RepID=UPI0012F869B0|nr:hypothetical protein [Actinoplanes subtropicus]
MFAAEAPKVTDWMQGLGTVGALLVSLIALWFTALLYLHEVRIRREEKADADAAQARLIFGRVVEFRAPAEMLSSVRYEVANHSSAPIFQLSAEVATPSRDTVRGGTEHDGLVGHPVLDLVADQPVPVGGGTTIQDLALTIDFTDAAGLRWRRTGRDAPVRILGAALPGTDSRPILALTAVTLSVLGIVLTLIALFG